MDERADVTQLDAKRTAEGLDVSPTTVRRDWRLASARLHDQLSESGSWPVADHRWGAVEKLFPQIHQHLSEEGRLRVSERLRDAVPREPGNGTLQQVRNVPAGISGDAGSRRLALDQAWRLAPLQEWQLDGPARP